MFGRGVLVVVCLAGVLLSACGGGGGGTAAIDFRDDEFNANPGLGAVNADAAYSRGAFGQGVTIAVIDSGIAITNTEFAGRIAAGLPGQNATTNANGDHGTFVAGVVGSARDGNGVHGIAPSVHLMPLRAGGSGENFAEASFAFAAAQNVPIVNNSYGFLYPFNAIDRATGATIIFNGPVLSPLLDAYQGINDNIINTTRRRLSAFADSMDGKDMVAVWAAGNEFWHPGASVRVFNISVNAGNLATLATVIRTPEYIISNYVIGVRISNNMRLSVSMHTGVTFTANAEGYTISAFSPYGVDSYSWGPRYHPELLGRWIAAIAVDNGGMLARFSNACGAAKNWCLAAPGVDVAVVGDGVLMTASGTSFSAPYISGALALLRSRSPQMPMSVIARLLLQTADDLGDAGVDDIYGHGMINLSAAMLAQSNAQMLMPNGAPLPIGGGVELPNAFAAFGDRLGGLRSAVRVLGNQYYDAPVNVAIADAPKLSSFRVIDNLWDDDNGGGINKGGNIINNSGIDDGVNFFAYRGDNGALHSAGGNYYQFQLRHHWFGDAPVWNVINNDASGNRPFFFSAAGGRSSEVNWQFDDAINIFAARGNEADGDYRQIGLRWQKQQGRLYFSSALSHIGEDETLLGGKFGGAMPLTGGGKTKMAELAAKWQLPGGGFGFDNNNNIGKLYLFGNYQYADIDAELGGLASGVSGLQAQGWQAGITADDIFRGGDKLRLAVGEEMAISGGKINLHYARATDAEFDEDTQLTINRGWQPAQQSIDLSAPARPMISAAYGMRLNNNAKLSFGITRTTTDKTNKTQAAFTYRQNF